MSIVTNVTANFNADSVLKCGGKTINYEMDVDAAVNEAVCPDCGEHLRYRQIVPRIIRTPNHERDGWCMVPKAQCPHCSRLITLLPRDLVPFKHYCSDTIGGVIDGSIDDLTPETAEAPSPETMRRWRRWFRKNLEYINGMLRLIRQKQTDEEQPADAGRKQLHAIIDECRQHQDPYWLVRVLIPIYAYGGCLTPVLN